MIRFTGNQRQCGVGCLAPSVNRSTYSKVRHIIHTSCDMMVGVGESHPDPADLGLLRWLGIGGVGGRYSYRL
jgi:hypothetical protein